MGIAARLESLLPDLAQALRRFPVAALAAVLLFLWWNVTGIGTVSGEDVMAGGAAAFLASGAAHLLAEGRKWQAVHGMMLALASALALAFIGYFTAVFATNYLFLFLGLVPALMVAAHLRADASQGALWLFNVRLWLSALLAVLVALVFAAGLSAIVGALDFLFGVSPPWNLHERIWGTAASLVAPLCGLSLVPRRLDEEIDMAAEKGGLLERGVSVLVAYVLVPVALVYAVILHAFAAKIAIVGELPRDQVATMVSVYAVGGTATWLIAWPWRETGAVLLRAFMRGWLFLTLVPAALLALAIGRRLADYGVTPDRYGIVVIAVWMAFVALYLALRRNLADMRVVIGAIGLLLLAGAAGPLGANGLTVSSQYGRLVALLEGQGLLAEGKARKAPALLAADVGSNGYSMLEAIRSAGGLDRLRPLFAGAKDDPFTVHSDQWNQANGIATYFGFSSGPMYADYLSFSANEPLSLALDGKRLVGPLQAFLRYGEAEQKPMTALIAGDRLTIKLDDAVYEVGLDFLLTEVKGKLAPVGGNQPAIAVVVAPGVTMVIDSFYGSPTSTPRISSARFWLILPR